jgi:short subunit dehydrogenase-like uncharacterized protein
MHTPRHARPFDLILFGATGFTGQLVARALTAESGLRWALAGRDLARLARVRDGLVATRPELSELTLLEADSGDRAALDALARQTRVVCTTVGPYDRLGGPLVAACAEAGTDYCDLTGEVPFIARMIADHDAQARASGARIVHACGFDSVPSDLGAWFAQRELARLGGGAAAVVSFQLGPARGGFSGGTVASMLELGARLGADPALRRLVADPWALAPARAGGWPRAPRDAFPPRRDPSTGRWQAPFLMASVNSRVVRRSQALFGLADGLAYDESVDCGAGLGGRMRAVGMTAGLAVGWKATTSSLARRLLMATVLPAPGEGPSEAKIAAGFWRARVMAWRAADGRRGPPEVTVNLAGERDPGYGSTSGMLAACALSLAFDPVAAGFEGGVLTPATALCGHVRADASPPIFERLARAGVRFEAQGAG